MPFPKEEDGVSGGLGNRRSIHLSYGAEKQNSEDSRTFRRQPPQRQPNGDPDASGVQSDRRARTEPHDDATGKLHRLSAILARTRRWRGHLLWTGPTDRDGYPDVTAGGEQRGHRAVYALTHGPIPEGMVIRHRCNLRHCLNAKHLAIGTHADNVADRVAADRSARGEDSGRAKLTEEDVLFIRSRARALGIGRTANFFGVCPKAIRLILSGRNWAHLLVEGAASTGGSR